MDNKEISNKENKSSNQIKPENNLENINSKYILRKIFSFMQIKRKLEIIKINKIIQQRININIDTYKEYNEIYSPIEIEIIPVKNVNGIFINLNLIGNQKYFHIYFDNNKEEEIDKTFLLKEDTVSKINIVIDYQISSFENLFHSCHCAESIYFKKFYRKNITNMFKMFSECSSLKEIKFFNINTDNITNMGYMFNRCASLKELNLSKFNTNNVTNISFMFNG